MYINFKTIIALLIVLSNKETFPSYSIGIENKSSKVVTIQSHTLKIRSFGYWWLKHVVQESQTIATILPGQHFLGEVRINFSLDFYKNNCHGK
jgi:hypothetical protein